MMFFVSATSTEPEIGAALASLIEQVNAQATQQSGEELPLDWVDLAIAFVSVHFTASARQIIEGLRSGLRPRALLGCTAEGVIGQDQEIEDSPAITLVAASLPGVVLSPFMLLAGDTDLPASTWSARATGGQADWHKLLLDPDEFRRVLDTPEDPRLFILLGDPFSTPMDDMLQAFNSNFPGVPVVGGMASGALRPYGNALWIDDQITHEGAVGLGLAGDLDVDVVVSQGCRPIWRPFKVITAHRNVIFNLEGRAPLAWLQDLIPELPEEDRLLLQKGLFVGRSIQAGQEGPGRGDYLLRGVTGIDQNSGAIAIGDSIMDGETIQFHLRDALTAKEDLEMMLIPQAFRPAPSGVLLFSCNGRGTRLYDHPNGDISVIQANLEGAHLAGFFCAGEIGPIGGVNFLHGHTASLAIFRPRPA
jgi:small ligand-binding sensory domain FIST